MRFGCFASIAILLIGSSWAAVAATPMIELEVANRFRLLPNETEQVRYFDDLEQRLVCGAYKNRKNLKLKKYCSEDRRLNANRLASNYQTRWIPQKYGFEQKYVHDLVRTLSLKVSGLLGNQLVRCNWIVNGKALDDHSCSKVEHKVVLGANRTLDVNLAAFVFGSTGKQIANPQKVVTVRDVVVVTIGDSFLSGEGNPHLANRLPIGNQDSALFGKRSEWLEVRCHRSLFTSAVIASERLARRFPTQSVTLVPLACSGAETNEGILGPYFGRETNVQANWVPPESNFAVPSKDVVFQSRNIPTEFEVLRTTLCPEHVATAACDDHRVKPDLIILATGANEIGFGDIVRKLGVGEAPSSDLAKKLDELPSLYEKIAKEMDQIKPKAVFALAYPDPTQQFAAGSKKKLAYCNDLSATKGDETFVPRFATMLNYGITEKGARAAQTQVVQPLNKKISDAAEKYHWRKLALPAEVQQGHGFCSKTASWFYTYSQSEEFQGLIGPDQDERHDNAPIGNIPSGAMHPNIFGHYNLSEMIFAEFGRPEVGLVPK